MPLRRMLFPSELKYFRQMGPTTIGFTPIAFASSMYFRIYSLYVPEAVVPR